MVQRKVLLLQMENVAIYLRSTLHEKTEFCKNVKFGSAVLVFH